MSASKIPRGKTGPTTSDGKRISSRNAAKHNCTSTQMIVAGEDPRAFAALLESLTVEYQPETENQTIIVLQAARTAWDLARINRAFDHSQQELYSVRQNVRDWDAGQQAEFERMLRYRTRAERAYARALQQVEFLRKLRLQAEQRAFWVNLQIEKLDLSKQRLKLSAGRAHQPAVKSVPAATLPAPAPGDASARANTERTSPDPADRPVVPLSQIIEIRVFEGTISMRVYPPNADLQRQADRAAAGAPVLRRFEFPDGIPAEYAWVNAPGIRHVGIVWIQRFPTVEEWRTHLSLEAATTNGRFLPTPKNV